EGLVLGSAPSAARSGPVAGYSLGIPKLGGITPGGVAIVHAFSTTHATERDVPPPDERPRFGRHQRFWVIDDEDTAVARIRWAFEVDQGSRRFLSFDTMSAAFKGVVREDFAVASLAAAIEPESRA